MKYPGMLYGFWIMILLAGCLVLTPPGSFATEPRPGPEPVSEQSETPIVIKGRVSKVLLEANQLFIKPSKQQKMLLLVNQQTIFIGFESLSELTRNQVLTVWYYLRDGNNIAVKIEKRLEVGC
jgi:hypothetical protein